MSDAPFLETLVPKSEDTEASATARTRLARALAELDPAGGKTDKRPAAAKAAKPKAKRKANAAKVLKPTENEK